MKKGYSILFVFLFFTNSLLILSSFMSTPVAALNYGMDSDLGNVNASFWGESEVDFFGASVAGAGDVNGDGYDDILIGAHRNSEGGVSAGQVYLIFGKASGWTMDINSSVSDASFLGENDHDWLGRSAVGAGDVNGDGYDDILIGADGNDDGGDIAGKSYLIFGKASGWTMDTDLSTSNASFIGENTNDISGLTVAGAGDVNGDGYDDILIGARGNSEGGEKAGQTYLILGKPSGWAMDTDLSESDASFWGEEGDDYPGLCLAGAGDVNGDGYDDFLIGTSRNDEGGEDAGQTYLIFGKASGWSMDTNLSASDASFLGENVKDGSGSSVAGAGDVNGDGFDDILIGASGNDDGGKRAGKSYLILGKASGWANDTNLFTSDASFLGEVADDLSGGSLAGSGDVNGDGYDDILIGVPSNYDAGVHAGQTYLILGKPFGWTMDTDLSGSDASFWGGGERDGSGGSVAGAGDVNGDGFDDILIGATGNDEGGDYAGQIYLIFPDNTSTPTLYDRTLDYKMDTRLANVDASFLGDEDRDYSGYSPTSAGDVNGDGYDDILIDAPINGDGGKRSGKTYLILGKPSGWVMDTNLSASDASFIGENAEDRSGCSLAGAGDVNGDGYDDILIGASGNGDGGENAGQTYLILGKPSGWAMDTDLSVSDASFIGENSHDCSGKGVAGAGDVNGDGYDDILIGTDNSESLDFPGLTYLILGKPSGWKMDVSLSRSDASFWGEEVDDHSGSAVAGAGDVNGDSYDDILIGATGSDRSGYCAGQTYLVLGKSSGWARDTDLSTSDASFLGESVGDWCGNSVAGAGDVNGDGYDDILIGANGDDDGGNLAGQTYLILGKLSGWKKGVSLSASDASFWGEEEDDISGDKISGAGDVNGDGYDDFLIGASQSDNGGLRFGQTYLILGKPSGWAMDMDLSVSDASFWGEEEKDFSGSHVAGAGDVNGDGCDDILIGTPSNHDFSDYAGQTYLIFPKYNSRSVLYDENLTPSYGNISTHFTFSILCRDNDSYQSFNVSLFIDEHGYSLTGYDIMSGDIIEGVRFRKTMKLTKGVHYYYYLATDGILDVRYPPVGNLTTPYILVDLEIGLQEDSDGDGFYDINESEMGSNPYNEYSTPLDYDGDEWNNSVETEVGTDPRDNTSFPPDMDEDRIPDSIDPDRDGDGVLNMDDVFPDDGTRWKKSEDGIAVVWWVIGIVVMVIVIIVVVLVSRRKRKVEEDGNDRSAVDKLGRVEKDGDGGKGYVRDVQKRTGGKLKVV